MIDEENIIIRNAAGVCSAEEDTRLLARVSAEVMPAGGRALDLGTGTGYVAIYLARKGFEVEATDINERALRLARENAALNGVHIPIYYSDMFAKVRGPYDVIAFNPPMNPHETGVTRWVTSFLRRHRSITNLLMRLFDRYFASSRVDFLMQTLRQARQHLAPHGCLVLELTRWEIDTLAARMPDFEFGRRVDIPRLPTEQIVVVRPRQESMA